MTKAQATSIINKAQPVNIYLLSTGESFQALLTFQSSNTVYAEYTWNGKTITGAFDRANVYLTKP